MPPVVLLFVSILVSSILCWSQNVPAREKQDPKTSIALCPDQASSELHFLGNYFRLYQYPQPPAASLPWIVLDSE